MKIFKALGLAILVVFAFVSCDLLMQLLEVEEEGTTVAARINLFEADLNLEDRTDLISTHFHPDDTQSFQQMQDTITTSTSPLRFDNEPFTISEPTSVETSGTSQIATCDFGNFVATGTIEFTLQLDGADYKIRRLELSIDGATDTFVIERYASRAL